MLKQVLEALDRKIHHTLELVQAGIIASVELRLASHRVLSARMFTMTEVNFASLLSLSGGAVPYDQIVNHATVVDSFGTMGVIIDIRSDSATVITVICAPDVEGLTRILENHDASPDAHSDIRQSVHNAQSRADQAYEYSVSLATQQGQITAKIPGNASVDNQLTTHNDICNFTSAANLQNQPDPVFGQVNRNGVAATAARSDHVHALPTLPAYTGNNSIRNSIGLGAGQGSVFSFNSETGELVIRV